MSNTIDRMRREAVDQAGNAWESVKRQNAEYQATRRAETSPSPKPAPTPREVKNLDRRREELANYNFKQPPNPPDKPKPAAPSPAPSNADVSRSMPRADPVPKPASPRDSQYYNVDSPKPSGRSDFGRAFAAARMQGAKEFTWNGKRYNTRRADGK